MSYQVGKMPGTGPTPPRLRADGMLRIRKSMFGNKKAQENISGSGTEFADYVKKQDEIRRESIIRRHKAHQESVTKKQI